jgi:hypothetical protein
MYSTAAESSSNPFWDAEENEGPRMARIIKILQRQPDAKSFGFFVAKSNNDNFVAYKWTGSEVSPTWISTQNVPAERRESLNLAEELLYGIEQRVSSTGDWIITMRAEPLKTRVINLTLNDADEPSFIAPVNNKLCILDHAYVQMRKGLIPDVEWVRITGHDMTGAVQTEIVNRV